MRERIVPGQEGYQPNTEKRGYQPNTENGGCQTQVTSTGDSITQNGYTPTVDGSNPPNPQPPSEE